MFTGLVQAVGRISAATVRPKGVRLAVDVGSWGYRRLARQGDSVSVAGVCLTVVAKRAGVLEFDVVEETLNKTTLGSLGVGDRVNLEHAATATTFMGGHLVQGHVDCVGGVNKVRRVEGDWRVWIGLANDLKWNVSEPDLWRYLAPKGSICVDGVSLTIAGLWAPDLRTSRSRAKRPAVARPAGFWVALIPETLARTTLGTLEAGDTVNIEIDTIAKSVVRTVERLREGSRSGIERVKLS